KMAKELSVVIQVNPGNTGFKVVQEMFAKIEVELLVQCLSPLYVGIQWFPKAARAMVLHGIEYCFIPLPLALNLETSDWLRVIIGVESCKAIAIDEMYVDSNHSRRLFIKTSIVCISFNKAFSITGNLLVETMIALSIALIMLRLRFCFWMVTRYKNRNSWQAQTADQARGLAHPADQQPFCPPVNYKYS
ncbi:hypothetical protein HID58_069416, partial [Brassica napus]